MISGKFIKQHKKSLSLMTFCFAAACLPLLATAQISPSTSQPSASAARKIVQQCGYTLRPSPVSFSAAPVMNFAFSINRDDNTNFGTLKQDSIEIFHDGERLSGAPNSLQNLTDAPVAAMILVDVSKSMRRQEFRKLDALKEALHGFIDRLQSKKANRIALAKFDNSLQMMQQATTDLDALHNAVDRLDGRSGTKFYEAINWALDRAKQDGVQNLIVLSDGVDSSPEAVYYRSTRQLDELLAFEDLQERKIIQKAQDYKIRIFSVGMGNTSEAYPSMYVYRDSPANISRGTGGGEDYYIDLLEMRQQQGYYNRGYYERLRETLSTMLEQIRQTYSYDYSLPLSLVGRAKPDGKTHTVAINFKMDRCTLPVEVKYVWKPGEPAPKESSTIINPPIFIDPRPMPGGHNMDSSEITLIYLIMMFALGLMSGVPLAGQRLAEERGTRQIRRAIIRVGKGSPYIGKECPSERGFRRFHEGDLLLVCPDLNCKVAHHLDCWYQAQGRCYRRNCSLSSRPRPLPESLAKSYKLSPGS